MGTVVKECQRGSPRTPGGQQRGRSGRPLGGSAACPGSTAQKPAPNTQAQDGGAGPGNPDQIRKKPRSPASGPRCGISHLCYQLLIKHGDPDPTGLSSRSLAQALSSSRSPLQTLTFPLSHSSARPRARPWGLAGSRPQSLGLPSSPAKR